MEALDSFIFWILTFLVLYLLRLIYKRGESKSLYFSYYIFLFLIFYGPILYYKIGFRAYKTMITYDALYIFMCISIFFFSINIFFFSLIKIKQKKYLFFNFFRQIKEREENNNLILKYYFYGVFVFVLSYIIIYFNRFPLIQLFLEGSLGLRPDTVEVMPLYISISAIFITIIPSAFLYFYHRSNRIILKNLGLLLTLFILIIGGNKGIISFFILFLFYYSSPKISYKKLLVVVAVLMFIYAYTKGITNFDKDTMAFLLESPFRRLFATQGVGFIGRIMMDLQGEFDLSSGIGIKNQVFSRMYGRDDGSVPTMFIGDILVKYGYVFALFSYLLYLIIMINLIKTVDRFFKGKKGMYITWNLFIVIELLSMSNLSLANLIRIAFVVINLLLINLFVRLKLKPKLSEG